MPDDDPFQTFNFRVQIEVTGAESIGLTSPLCDCGFAECDGLEMTMEPKTVREGGNNREQIQLAGPVTYGNLTLKRGMTANLDLWRWFTAVAGSAGRVGQAEGFITLKSADGRSDNLRFTVHGCLPIKIRAPALNAREGQIAIEEMQIAYSSFTVEPGG